MIEDRAVRYSATALDSPPSPRSLGTAMKDVSDQALELIALRLKAMGNPFRLRILRALHDGELSVSEIVGQVGGSQANVSKHLRVLKGCDLVRCRRHGVSVYYRISDPTVATICETVCDALLHQASAEVATIAEARTRLRLAS